MSPRVCPRCGKENELENAFCSRCGLEFATVQTDPIPETEPQFCHWHPTVSTVLKCGKCDRNICDRCVVISPAGTRCRECSKNSVAFRPGAVVHEAKIGARSLLRAGPWTIWILIILAGSIVGGIRGCQMSQSHDEIPIEFEESPSQSSGPGDPEQKL